MSQKLATFKIDADVWQAFQTKAKEQNSNASAELKRFILSYLDDDEGDRLSDIESKLSELDERLGKLSVA